MLEIFALLIAGALVGIVAGLFGTGGGSVTVPTLIFLFNYKGLPAEIIPSLAIGTSLATIIFTSLASMRQHYKQGSLQVPLFLKISPSIFIGAILGGVFASQLPGKVLQSAFAIFLIFVAVQIFTGRVAKKHRSLPGITGLSALGVIIGSVSALFGVGGASLSVPILTACNVSVRNAIGTAAAICLPLAISATITNVAMGWKTVGLPPGSYGFVNIPMMAVLALSSIFFAPYGAKLAHALPEKTLKRTFAVFLLGVSAKLLF